MASLSKTQVVEIIKKAPQGTTPEGIVSALRQQGYQLEGYPEPAQPKVAPEQNVADKVSGFLGMKKFGQGVGQAVSNIAGGTDALEQAQGRTLDIQGNLVQRIKEKRQRGEDTSRLERALADITEEIGGQSATLAEAGTGGLTNKEFVGSALQTAANFIPGLGRGASLTAKVGVGAGTGYAFDVASNLQNNKSGTDIFKPGAGTAIGAGLPLTGALLGWTAKITGLTPTGLEKTNLRLTPTEKRNLEKKGSDVVEYLTNKKIVGTPEGRFAKVDKLYDAMESKVSETVKGSGKTFTKQELLDQIDSIGSEFLDDPIGSSEASNIAEKIKQFIVTMPGETITASQVNAMKRNLYKRAYSKNNTDVINEALYFAGDRFKGLLDNSIKGLETLNKEYGTIITARNILGKAMTRNQSGVFGRAAGAGAGGAIGMAMSGPTGAAIGGFIGQGAVNKISTPVRSALGATMKTIVDKIPTDKAGNLQITKKALLNLINSQR